MRILDLNYTFEWDNELIYDDILNISFYKLKIQELNKDDKIIRSNEVYVLGNINLLIKLSCPFRENLAQKLLKMKEGTKIQFELNIKVTEL